MSRETRRSKRENRIHNVQKKKIGERVRKRGEDSGSKVVEVRLDREFSLKFPSGCMDSTGNMWILEKNTPQQPGGLKQRVISALLYCTGEMKQLHTHMKGKRPPSYSTQHSSHTNIITSTFKCKMRSLYQNDTAYSKYCFL